MYFQLERISRIVDELRNYMYSDSKEVKSLRMKEGNFQGGEKADLDDSSWMQFHAGDRWGGKDLHFWFRTEIRIPENLRGKTLVYEVKTGREGNWDALNPQFLIYVNGKLIQGMDVNHRDIILTESAVTNETFLIALNSYSGMADGLVELKCRLSVLEREVEKLYYDIKVPLEVARLLSEGDKTRMDILNLLTEAVNLLDLRKPCSDAFNKSVRDASSFLDEEFYNRFCGHTDTVVDCVGHTHIDVAWLWTLAQTREKTARSFSTVLNLMKQYPEYIFMSSQPQLYKFIKEDHPEIYSEIKERAAEGRWEPEGAMWLEADCNISSGESLIRQVLFGTRFFEKEFGVKNRILWLPDVFGYSAALPQILKKSGIDYFMTTKISWNEYNKLPYDTFMWKGIDGTEILSHFITAAEYKSLPRSHETTYNADITPSQVRGAWERYQQKDINSEVLISYGFGDGGGGPTKEMLENARRLSRGIPGCPRVKMSTSLDFFKNLEKTVSDRKRLPKWVGELYLEYHRGTYTTMARNKKFNRKSEFLYQDVEFLSVLANTLAGFPDYPQAKINSGWETILLNQFHDILPGSSIKQVYEDSKQQYTGIISKGRTLAGNAIEKIASGISLSDLSVVVFNQLSFDRSDLVEFQLPEGYDSVEVSDYSGKPMKVQLLESHEPTARKAVFLAEAVPAKGYKAFRLKRGTSALPCITQECSIDVSENSLSNRFYDIRLDTAGNIISLYDKVNCRQVLREGQRGNVLQAFEDKPHNYDAWDINIYYQEKMWEINEAESVEILEKGPVMASLKVVRRFLDSKLVQEIRIYNDIPRIDFKNTIDWKEKQILLKAAFPIDVHTDKASYEIQYGNVERATHWNTSWDYAKFEVCAHKWADMSEDNYGVSLINDCKYGYDIKDGIMRLTLLKSPIYPNEDADREIHEFVYSLYPHGGDWKKADTIQMAYNLNCPMYYKVEQPHTGTLPLELSLLRINARNVIAEVVKKAEDSGYIIVRVYEAFNRRTSAVLTFCSELSEVWECDLMENNMSELEILGNTFKFCIQPYEIKTFKLTLK